MVKDRDRYREKALKSVYGYGTDERAIPTNREVK